MKQYGVVVADELLADFRVASIWLLLCVLLLVVDSAIQRSLFFVNEQTVTTHVGLDLTQQPSRSSILLEILPLSFSSISHLQFPSQLHTTHNA